MTLGGGLPCAGAARGVASGRSTAGAGLGTSAARLTGGGAGLAAPLQAVLWQEGDDYQLGRTTWPLVGGSRVAALWSSPLGARRWLGLARAGEEALAPVVFCGLQTLGTALGRSSASGRRAGCLNGCLLQGLSLRFHSPKKSQRGRLRSAEEGR